MEPQTQAPWQRNAQVFHERADEYDNWFDNSLLFTIEKTAIQSLNIVGAGPALEIGIGPGRFAEALQIPFGIDPAFAPLRLAQKRGRATCQAIAEELPFADSSAGAIYLLFTLCFLVSPAQCLQECRRVLRPGAPLIIGCVPAAGAWGRYLHAKKEKGHPFYQGARFYTLAAIRHFLEANHFQICQGMSTLYQCPEKVQAAEPARPGLDEQAGFVVIEAR